MPAAIVPGEGVDFIDDDGTKVGKHSLFLDPSGNQHHLERLGGREEQVGWVGKDRPPRRVSDVTVPDRSAAADEVAVVGQPHMKVVQQRLERAEVED